MTNETQAQATGWTSDDLRRVGTSDELRISAMRPDGTLREPTTIWVVRVRNRLCIRSAYGNDAAWWRAARRAGRGHIQAGGVEKDVTFVDVAPEHYDNDDIDDAYRTKYRRYSPSLVNTMTTPDARATTLELKPRATS